jgi:hypothetical protein
MQSGKACCTARRIFAAAIFDSLHRALSIPTRPLPYGRQHITDADVAAVTAALHADFLTQGPAVAEFEARNLPNISGPNMPWP